MRCGVGSALEQAPQTKAFALLFGLVLLGGRGGLFAEQFLGQCRVVGLAIGSTLFLWCAVVPLAVAAITLLGGAVVALLLALANSGNANSSWLVAVSFVIGALCSGAAGFFGMSVATKANVRTTQAARTGLAPALNVAFSGGLVMGLSVVGLGLFGLGTLFIVYDTFTDWSTIKIINVVTGFSLGASSIALFARVGGGIYTKAADVTRKRLYLESMEKVLSGVDQKIIIDSDMNQILPLLQLQGGSNND